MSRLREAVALVSGGGTRLYVLPVESFPRHWTNVVLVDHPDHRLLFDLGTPRSHPGLRARFGEIHARFGVRTRLEDVDEVLFSHAHADHYGDAWSLRRLGVPLAIHALGVEVLADHRARRLRQQGVLAGFLEAAGAPEPVVRALSELYVSAKEPFADLRPERAVLDGDRVGPGWEVLHMPGHAPDCVCLVVDDVVLTGDHLLADTTPVQQPDAVVPGGGLGAYLASLERLTAEGPFAVGVGAHDRVIDDVGARIAATREHHAERLERVRALCADRPHTAWEVARTLFGDVPGYGALLALSEAAAHLELLVERGRLEAAGHPARHGRAA